MGHSIEVSPSGRATCRTCKEKIGKDELRFGEEVPSQFGSSGFSKVWHHLACAATKKSALVAPVLEAYEGDVPNRDELAGLIKGGGASPKAKGVAGALPNADVAPTGRAKCISCTESIPKASVRIAVEREIDTGSFTTKGAGYLHPACLEAWAEEAGMAFEDVLAQVEQNTALPALPPPLGDADPALFEAAASATKKTKKKSPSKKSASKEEPAATKKAATKKAATKKAATKKAATKKAATKKASTKKEATSTGDIPEFAGLSSKKLASLGAKLDKTFDPNGHKHSTIFHKVDVPYNDREKLWWHLVEHGAVQAENNAGMLRMLSERAGSAPPAVLAALVTRLPPTLKPMMGKYGGTELLPNWSYSMEDLATHAVAVAPEALANAENVAPNVRVGINFVRGRSGLPLSEDEKAEVLEALAAGEMTGHGIRHTSLNTVLDGKVIQQEQVKSSADVAALASHFGDADAWANALSKHLSSKWQSIEQAMPALLRVPLDELPPLLLSNHKSLGIASLFSLLDQRGDTPASVLALELGGEPDAVRLRELLVVWSLSCLAKAGEPLPDDALGALNLDPLNASFNDAQRAALRDGYLSAFGAVSKERALALARRKLEEPYSYAGGLGVLAVHFDEALLQDFLHKDETNAYLPAHVFAAIGPQALGPLVEAYESANVKTKDRRLQAIVAVLAKNAGAPFDAAEQNALDALGAAVIDTSDTESYWADERARALETLVERLDNTTRARFIGEAIQAAKRPERVFRLVGRCADRSFRLQTIRTIVEQSSKLTNDPHFDIGVKSLGDDAPALFAEATGGEGNAAFMRRLEKALGADGFAKFGAASGATKKSWLEALQAIGAEAKGPHQRIYLLEPQWRLEDVASSRLTDSLSSLGGAGPSGVDAPLRADGEPMTHVLTLDLREIPELAKTYGKTAAAVALFVPDAEMGEDYESSVLLEVPAGAAPASDGDSLHVLSLDVPSAIFDHDASRDDAGLGELRKAVFNRSGWALGEPMWIQDDEGGSNDFLMQLGEALGLNVGDSGSLYVYKSYALMQCY